MKISLILGIPPYFLIFFQAQNADKWWVWRGLNVRAGTPNFTQGIHFCYYLGALWPSFRVFCLLSQKLGQNDSRIDIFFYGHWNVHRPFIYFVCVLTNDSFALTLYPFLIYTIRERKRYSVNDSCIIIFFRFFFKCNWLIFFCMIRSLHTFSSCCVAGPPRDQERWNGVFLFLHWNFLIGSMIWVWCTRDKIANELQRKS